MWDNIIYTNAHVILENNMYYYDEKKEEAKPVWNYRVCKTTDFKEKPECFSTWKLLYYDEKNDLAALEILNPWVSWVKKSTKELEIWDTVKVYGYPSNWGQTISYTEGKISWYDDEQWLYKIDANIDSWNSWGGAFDSEGNLIGIAVSVKVWYTTMWYIIPLEKINNFKNKKWTIKKYDEKINKEFETYIKNIEGVIWATKFENHEISISSFLEYSLKVNDYTIDNNEEYYHLWLSNKEKDPYVSISNLKFSWKEDITVDVILENIKREYDEIKKLEYYNEQIKTVKIKKVKLLKRDTVLMFTKGTDWKVGLGLIFEVWKNRYQSILLTSDSMNNKSFF